MYPKSANQKRIVGVKQKQCLKLFEDDILNSPIWVSWVFNKM